MNSDKNKHLGLCTDVTKKASVEKAFIKVIEKYSSPPSLLVNNAGVIKSSLLQELPEQDFTCQIDVNLKVKKIFNFEYNNFYYLT